MTSVIGMLFTFALFLSSFGVEADPQQEITRGLAEGLQQNTDLRKMLIGKWMADNNFAAAMKQYRHIVRIQTEEFGANSEEASVATKEAQAHLELLMKHEDEEFHKFTQDPEGVQAALNEEGKKMLANNLKVQELLAKQKVDEGKHSAAINLYKKIAEDIADRYGSESQEYAAAIARATKHAEL
jgi:hypothetical protein